MRPAADSSPASPPSPDPAAAAEARAFLRVVSHELRTPLNSIIGFSEILATELYGPLGSPDYKDYAGIIRDSGTKLLKLVNQVLEIARLQSGVVEWELGAEPLGPAIDAVLSRAAGDLVRRGARIAVDKADALPDVRADARGLQTVLCGLVQNAVLYSPPGSQVRIAAARRGRTVEILIENPGERLEPAEVERFLKPFEQAETALTRATEGPGLGLMVCDLTCRSMDGTLALRALPEGGVSASVRLPAA